MKKYIALIVVTMALSLGGCLMGTFDDTQPHKKILKKSDE